MEFTTSVKQYKHRTNEQPFYEGECFYTQLTQTDLFIHVLSNKQGKVQVCNCSGHMICSEFKNH